MSAILGNVTFNDLISGSSLLFRQPVVAATTANATLATEYADSKTVDGITLVTGDRLLIMNQSTGSENGLYIVTAGVPVRANDLQTDSSAAGIIIPVSGGTTNGYGYFICTNAAGSDVVGTNALIFNTFRSPGVGTLSVSNGGTGATTFSSGSVLIGNGTGTITATKAAPTGDFVGTNDTQTLASKILTSPIINQINDANGLESIIFTSTALAVNELTIANSATGTNPTVSASGGDANVGINIIPKGTGVFSVGGSATGSGEVRLLELSGNGTSYIGLTAPDSITTSVSYALPEAPSTGGSRLVSTTGGVLSWEANTSIDGQIYNMLSNPVEVNVDASYDVNIPFSYFPFDYSQYTTFTTCTVTCYVNVPGTTTVSAIHVYQTVDGSGTSLGNSGAASSTGIVSFDLSSISTSDKLWCLRASRTTGTAPHPIIYAATLRFTI